MTSDTPRKAEHLLAEEGLFAGFQGLRGFNDASEFWARQEYGTRLYYGHGGGDYLHHSVLDCAISALDKAAQRIPELERDLATLKAENEALRKDAERYRWLRERSQEYALADFSVNPGDAISGEWVIIEQGASENEFDAAIDSARKP